jgi:hypothetical protein
MHNNCNAHSTIQRAIPARSGRRRELSETAVKALRQKRRPASPLYAEVSEAGFYIQGRSSLRVATATPAEPNALRPGSREASAAALYRARSKDRQRGAITKRLQNKIETDLLRVLVFIPTSPPYKAL